MTTKRKPQRWGTEKKWFSTSEAARYLGVSVDKVRQLDESGELPAERTKGGHRRFSRKALDAYLARKGGGCKPRTNERPKRTPRHIARPEPVRDAIDDEAERFEPGDEEFEPLIGASPPLSPMEQLARDVAEGRKRDEAEALERRLATLKQHGLNQVGWGIPDVWRARVAAALESYVTLKAFPAWVSDTEGYRIVRGKVEEILQPYHDQVARKKREETLREEEAATKRREQDAEAEEERKIQRLIADGMRHARVEIPFDWGYDDTTRALRDVERMLKDSVEGDWTDQDVKDAVDDELDAWEDDDPEDDEEEES